MKKLALTIAIVLGMCFTSFAQGGGLFQYGMVSDENYNGFGYYQEFDRATGWTGAPLLPVHAETTNQNAPLGSGALLLIGFGAAYALKKRNKK